MKNLGVIGFIYAYVFLLGGVIQAQEGFEDIFEEGAFEASVQESVDQDAQNQLEYLWGNTLVSDSSLNSSLERGGYNAQVANFGKFFLKASKPDTGALFASWSWRQLLAAGTNDSFFQEAYKWQTLETGKVDFALSELHLSFDLTKILFLRLGNQLLSWGSTVYWSPADFVNLQKQAFGAPADLRSGKPGLRLHLPLESANVFVFLDLSKVVQGGKAGDFVQDTGLAWRLDATQWGIRLGTNGYFVPRQGSENLRMVQLGLDLTTALMGIDLYTEGGLTLEEGKDVRGQFAAGFSRAFGDSGEWVLSGEGFWNPAGEGDRDVPPYGSPQLLGLNSLYWGQYYAWGQIRRTGLLEKKLDVSLSGVTNLSDRSWKAGVQTDWALPGLIPLTLSGGITGGDKAREFTYLAGGPSWSLGLRTLISF